MIEMKSKYSGLKENQGIVLQMDLSRVNVIEMKQKYFRLKWNPMILIVNRLMCGLYNWYLNFCMTIF